MLGPWIELTAARGVLAFVLNFIPFIGPFVATVLLALFAIVQFQSWEAATLIFAGVSLIQFLIGSYLEPRLSRECCNWSLLRTVISVSTPSRTSGRSGSSDRLRGEMKLALPFGVVHLRSRAGIGLSKPSGSSMRSLKSAKIAG